MPVLYGDEILIKNQEAGLYWLQWDESSTTSTGEPKFTLDESSITSVASVWKILTTSKGDFGGQVPVQYGDEIIFENQQTGYLLQRDVKVAFTMDQAQIANKAAVWKILNTSLGATSFGGNRNVDYGSEFVIENQYPGNFLLQRNKIPSFTVSEQRIDVKAAVWTFSSTTLPVRYHVRVRFLSWVSWSMLGVPGPPSPRAATTNSCGDQESISPVSKIFSGLGSRSLRICFGLF